MTLAPGAAPPLLFEPGERLGWEFWDRFLEMRPYPEPEPALRPAPAWLCALADHWRPLTFRRLGPYLSAAAVMLFLGLCVSGSSAALAAVLAVAGLVTGLWPVSMRALWDRLLGAVNARNLRRYDEAMEAWREGARQHEAAERQRLDHTPEWGAVQLLPGTTRLDVVGGLPVGWGAFLTVLGTSAHVENPPLVVLDLSGFRASGPLVDALTAHGAKVDVHVLPAGAAACDPLLGLTADQRIEVLVAAMHPQDHTTVRSDRVRDAHLLRSIADALRRSGDPGGDEPTVARLVEAIRSMLAESPRRARPPEAVEAALTEVFSAEYLREARPALQRIDTHLSTVAELGEQATSPVAGPSASCLTFTERGPGAELLAQIVFQSLIARMEAGLLRPGTVIVAGADDVAPRHLTRLSDLCDQTGTRLTCLFRTLEASLSAVIGGGAVAFMRLTGAGADERAASFIGRHHRFTLSGLTVNTGTSESVNVGVSEGESRSSGSSGRSFALLKWSAYDSWQEGYSSSSGRSEGASWSRSEGLSASLQRVYEYHVEPRALRDLAIFAMLLVEPTRTGPLLRSVEFHPDIPSLPRVLPYPFPDEPHPTGWPP